MKNALYLCLCFIPEAVTKTPFLAVGNRGRDPASYHKETRSFQPLHWYYREIGLPCKRPSRTVNSNLLKKEGESENTWCLAEN